MTDWYDGPLDEPTVDKRTLFDLAPLRSALRYVVEEAKKHQAAGNDDHFVAVGRVCQAALTWQKFDEQGRLEEAERWLKIIPRT